MIKTINRKEEADVYIFECTVCDNGVIIVA